MDAARSVARRRAGLDFTIACPTCGVASDIADVPMRLRPPEGWHDDSRTAALALRVAAAVRSMR